MVYLRASVLHGNRVCGEADEEGPAKTYGAARTCAVPGCGTLLSRYNPSELCCLHHGWAQAPPPARVRVAREAQIRTCQNSRCGREFATGNPAKKYCCDRCRMQAFQHRVAAESSRAAA